MNRVCTHCGSRAKPDAEKCANCGSTALEGREPPEGEVKVRSPRGWLAALGCGGLGLGALFCLGAISALIQRRPSGPPPSVRADTPAPGLSGFEAIRARGTLKVGVDPDAPPFLQRTADGWEGFEYALLSAIAETAKVELELVPLAYGDLLPAAAGGQVDLAVAQLPPQPRRGVDFSRSYLQYSLCLVVRADDPRRQLPAIHGPIGMYDDPTARQVLARAGAKNSRIYDDSGYFADLAAGTIDAVVYDCPLVRTELRSDPSASKLQIADDHLAVATYSVAVSQRTPGLAPDVDRVLTDLGRGGLLPQLASRWLGMEPPSAFQGTDSRGVVVEAGEDLAAVATRTGVSATNLQDWNGDILGSGAAEVYPGMLLRVR